MAIIEAAFPSIDTPVTCHVLGNNYFPAPIHANQIHADVYARVTLELAYRATLYCDNRVVDLRLPEFMVETSETILAEVLQAIESEASVIHTMTVITNARTALDTAT